MLTLICSTLTLASRAAKRFNYRTGARSSVKVVVAVAEVVVVTEPMDRALRCGGSLQPRVARAVAIFSIRVGLFFGRPQTIGRSFEGSYTHLTTNNQCGGEQT